MTTPSGAFTDEDLALMKLHAGKKNKPLLALLRRLECAEAFINHEDSINPYVSEDSFYQAWKRSKGL